MPWNELGSVDPEQLAETRLQLHWAAQVAAAPGSSLLPAEPDFGNFALEHLADRRLLAGPLVPGRHAWRAALSIADAALHVLDEQGEDLARLPVAGQTLESCLDWLSRSVAVCMAEPTGTLALPAQRPPDHPIGEGQPFPEPSAAHLAELDRWLAAAHATIEPVRRSQSGASRLRTWPHHFDTATLVTLDPGLDAEQARSFGIGLSPGDGSYAQPYFYVTPWPYPAADDLPDLPSGACWHVEGWVGAVLTGRDVVAAPDADARRARVETFLDTAVASSRALLERLGG